MSQFVKLQDNVFSRAQYVNAAYENLGYRKDCNGNWIRRSDYGDWNSKFSWEIVDSSVSASDSNVADVCKPLRLGEFIEAYGDRSIVSRIAKSVFVDGEIPASGNNAPPIEDASVEGGLVDSNLGILTCLEHRDQVFGVALNRFLDQPMAATIKPTRIPPTLNPFQNDS